MTAEIDGGTGGAPLDRKVEGENVYELFQREQDLEVLVDGKSVLRSNEQSGAPGVVDLALAPWEPREDLSVLLGGIGMGLTLQALLKRAAVVKVDAVEMSPTIVDWARTRFGELNGGAMADPRVTVHTAELGAFLREPQPDGTRRTGWFVVLVDTDQWPISLARPENVDFYHDDGLLVLETALRPGGVLAIRTARRDDELDARLRKRFQSVARISVVDDSPSGMSYVYRGRRSGVGGGTT
jgi:predicted membrane-bound spermidine synthase